MLNWSLYWLSISLLNYAKFSKESSVNQQNAYLEVAREIKENYSNINVVEIDTCIGVEGVKEKILEILNLWYSLYSIADWRKTRVNWV